MRYYLDEKDEINPTKQQYAPIETDHFCDYCSVFEEEEVVPIATYRAKEIKGEFEDRLRFPRAVYLCKECWEQLPNE